jgi:hypothetical protein
MDNAEAAIDLNEKSSVSSESYLTQMINKSEASHSALSDDFHPFNYLTDGKIHVDLCPELTSNRSTRGIMLARELHSSRNIHGVGKIAWDANLLLSDHLNGL